jgi:hypothetical protein
VGLERRVAARGGGDIPRRLWTLQTAARVTIIERGDAGSAISPRRPCVYFTAMFPPNQLARMVEVISDRLETIEQPQLTTGELLNFFGVLILGALHEIGQRADLWKTEVGNRPLQAPAVGTKTGMPRKRFDAIWSSLAFSRQGDSGDEKCSAAHRWPLVSEFVTSIHSHRSAHFSPSELVCVESIARWYGQGGHWIEHGLQLYVAIDCKPKTGCEIQISACGRSGIMMQLQLVTTAEHEETRASEAEVGLKHGTVVLDRLVRPWYGKGDRIVCGLVFCECQGRAAPAGPRVPVHRGSQDRYIQLPDEAATVQGNAVSRGFVELRAPARRQDCRHGRGVGRPQAAAHFLHRLQRREGHHVR